jgi:hypothetical protein
MSGLSELGLCALGYRGYVEVTSNIFSSSGRSSQSLRPGRRQRGIRACRDPIYHLGKCRSLCGLERERDVNYVPLALPTYRQPAALEHGKHGRIMCKHLGLEGG